MSSIHFRITNNPWINNGLAILANQAIRQEIGTDIQVEYRQDGMILSAEPDIQSTVAKILHNLAASGTYNFSTAFKIINKELDDSNYAPHSSYPKSPKDCKVTMKIKEHEKPALKTHKITDRNTNQQVWKQRLSYLSDATNYERYGLNFKSTPEFKRLAVPIDGNRVCYFCGLQTKTEVDLKQGFNPIASEHHNNSPDGISPKNDGRQNLRSCPRCFTLSLFCLFNRYVPFFQDSKRNMKLALPTTIDIQVLKKVMNNLTIPSQIIDFHNHSALSYSTNIKNMVYSSNAGCMLTLLHNILNEYHEEEVKEIEFTFEDISEEEFAQITDWLLLGKSSKMKTIGANARIYSLLRQQHNTKTNTYVYLVTDALKYFPFGNVSEFETNQFLEAILHLDGKRIATGMFLFAKRSIETAPKRIDKFELFKRIFMDKIFEEVLMLSEESREACKSIARSVGSGFHTDVGMMTKFAYASNVSEFKNALEDAVFRLAKVSALEDGTRNWVDQKALSVLFDTLEEHEFSELKNYFVSFMSAQVITANYIPKKSNGGKEK